MAFSRPRESNSMLVLVFLHAPVETVYRVITEPDQISQWFSDAAELDPRPGGEGILTFEDRATSKQMAVRLRVVSADPPHRFAFRWDYPDGEQARDTQLLVAYVCYRRASDRASRIMDGVDNSHYSLVAAAAQAAGPCPAGEEAAWGRRVHALTVDLHLIAQQARQDIERLESARTFVAFLEKVEIEQSSRRGLVTLRLPSGESEPIRTEHADTDRGRALVERARSLEGRWVLVYRYNERKAGERNQSIRMLAHLMDLGGDGSVPNTTAKKMILNDVGGDVARAQEAWTAAGLPDSGPITVDQLEQARTAARDPG